MFFATAVTTFLAAAGTVAAGYGGQWRSRGTCIYGSDVDAIVEKYVALVSDIGSLSDAEIDEALHPDFVDWSNSINAFFGKDYSLPAFESKAAFVAAQQNTQQQPITVEDYMNNCNNVFLIWTADNLPGARGISVVEVVKPEDTWQIARIDVEFNSLAWAAGVGGGYKVFGQCVGLDECSA